MLEAYTGFNPDIIVRYFTERGWPVSLIPYSDVHLVTVQKGAPLECGDGRFDELKDRESRGVRVFGGINAIMAILTGGDEVGLERAKYLIEKFGATPGTHSAEEGGCGYADLWMNNLLESALYPHELHLLRGSERIGQRLQEAMTALGGRHFRLNGNHKEEGVRINPFRNNTEGATDGRRFRIDDWFMADLGVPDKVRFFKIAETVEKLKPGAAKLEIIIP